VESAAFREKHIGDALLDANRISDCQAIRYLLNEIPLHSLASRDYFPLWRKMSWKFNVRVISDLNFAPITSWTANEEDMYRLLAN